MSPRSAAAGVLATMALAGCGEASSPQPASTEFPTVRIHNVAMQPALSLQQVVPYDRAAYAERGPRRGDVVAFHPPRAARGGRCGRSVSPRRAPAPCARTQGRPLSEIWVLRVVGIPGDGVRFSNGRAIVNGVEEGRSRLTLCDSPTERACSYRREVRVPDDAYFLAGDFRSGAVDSRYWGPVRRAQILGRIDVPPER